MRCKFYSQSVIALMLLSSLTTHAGSQGPVQPTLASNLYVATLIAGPAWARAGVTQTFYLQPDVQKTYDAKVGNRGITELGLFLGMQREIMPQLDGQLGLVFVATTRAMMTGDIWEDADPNFNNYTYNYKVRHSHVAIKGKVIADIKKVVRPYLGMSLGLGRNRAQDFIITPKIEEEVPAPDFTGNSSTAFTYALEAGFQQAINANWKAGIGYEFADWGQSRLSVAPGQTLNSGLKLSHVYTNGLLFSLSYIA